MSITVTTQKELDQALADKADVVYIDAPAEIWLTLSASDSSRVVARDSSRVEAWDSSRVEAWGSSSVEARDSSSVEAWGSSSVVARDSSSVEARGSSRVEAWGSSSVVARDSSRVEAWDSSRVEAWDSSRVEARGSSSVVARDSSRVEAGAYVAIHLHSKRVTLIGGVVIDVTNIDTYDLDTWVDYHGATRDGDTITVYKAVDADLTSNHGATYPIGETVTAPDWRPTQDCGNGLHFGVSPSAAKSYMVDAARFLECEVDVSEAVALGDKVKAKSCRVVREVTLWGDPIGAVSS